MEKASPTVRGAGTAPLSIEAYPLSSTGPGAAHELRVWRVRGAAGGPSAYLQAGVHAGEQPGMLALILLLRRLAALPAEQVLGDVVLAPLANPIGAGQWVHGELVGRCDLAGGSNFNRRFPAELAGRAAGIEGDFAAAAQAALQPPRATSPLESLRRRLMALAVQHDLVVDCHADTRSLLHLFAPPHLRQSAVDLGSAVGAAYVLEGEAPDSGSFEDAVNGFWRACAGLRPEWRDALAGRAAMTLELRGRADVDLAVAQEDADGLFAFLCERGVVSDPGGRPRAACAPLVTPATAVLRHRAPSPGLVAFRVPLGARVRRGEVVAELFRPDAVGLDGLAAPIAAQCDGVVLSLSHQHLLPAGAVVFKLVADDAAAQGDEILDD